MPEQAFSIRVASFTNAVTSGVATGKTGEHLHIDIAIKKTRSFLSSRDVEGGTNRNRATFHRSRRVFFAPRVSHKIVARLYGGKRRCGKDERCDRLGGVF